MVRPSKIELSPTASLAQPPNDLENQLKMNKLRTDKIRRTIHTKAKTARPLMTKRPSEVEKMSLDDWKRLREELHSKPPVNRKIKPPKKEFKHPPPPMNANDKPIVPAKV